MSYTAQLQQRKTQLEAAIANSAFKEWIVEYAAVLQALGQGGVTIPGGSADPLWQSQTIAPADYTSSGNGSVEHRQTVPAGQEWQIIAGSARWQCSLGSAPRSFGIFCNTADGNPLFETFSNEGLGASRIVQFNFGVTHPGSAVVSATRTIVTLSLPPLILRPGEEIVLWQNGAQENDTFRQRLRVMERSI